ncbi:condensin complex component Cnd2 [Gigaspora margarita]|uniref:Condensin complex subunit 2 n=1 Tax=Gigaspora margarita TaxID=4874 RepID=A0A8H4APL4_GIGMA|nr:condensin complex component Cnd2 [Gigaspora margarita]
MPSAAFETPKRRHSIGSPLKNHREFTVPLNDDASEKRERRKSLVDSVRRSLLFASPSAVASGSEGQNIPGSQMSTPQRVGTLSIEPATPIPKIPVEQMYLNFEEWMKMATDNKINANNSWKLALIDYFHEMSLLKEGDSINFQKASCTLDGCVKIYTSRVDSVATETGKLLSGLADSSKNNNEDSTSDGDDDNTDPERPARKKSSTTGTATLVKDYSQLTIKKFDLEFSVDPLFKKTSADFDEGGAQGLLLNHLSIDTDGKIIFDASDATLDEAEENENDERDGDAMEEDFPEQTMDISKLRSKIFPELSRLFTKDICPSLKSFEFSVDIGFLTRRGSDDDDNEDREDQEDQVITDDIIGDDNYPDFFDDNFLSGEEGGGGDDDDDGISGIFEGFDGGPREPRERIPEKDYIMAMANNTNDTFQYFDSAFLRNWAGPEHWKLKPTVRGDANGAPKERKKREPFSIDFIDSEDLNERTIFASAVNSIVLPKLAENVPHAHRLPDDIHFSSKQLVQLFLKPGFMLKARRRYEEQLAETDNVEVDENFWAEENIDPATNTSFPDMTMVTTGDTFLHDDDGFEEDIVEAEFGDNLVSQARRNKPEYIKYAKTAKRIDVKKLKENIWKTLTDTTENETYSIDSTQEVAQEVEEQKFTNVIENLKKIYPEKKMKDISVSFCFICLLHLANEKNLSISIENDNLSDLMIQQEKDITTEKRGEKRKSM